MKILVLGGNGFLGSHIVDELVLYGHEVSIFDRNVDKFKAHNAKLKCYSGSISDSVLLAEALENVELVIHSVSTTVPSTSNRDPAADVQQNLLPTIHLLDLMRQSSVNRLIYLSSGGTVYGTPNEIPVNERHSLNPICSYGVVKLAIEHYIGMFKELYGLKPIILRPSNPYGIRQGHDGVQGALSTFLMHNLQNKGISIWGDGGITRGYIYAKDFASLCRIAAESNQTGTFNVCSGEGYTLNELIALIEKITGKKSIIDYLPSRNFDVKNIVLDSTKAKSTFNWKPEYTLHDGVTEFYKNILS
jgi:UDP-glucose 4-epimerase